jgi:hypothetical protein
VYASGRAQPLRRDPVDVQRHGERQRQRDHDRDQRRDQRAVDEGEGAVLTGELVPGAPGVPLGAGEEAPDALVLEDGERVAGRRADHQPQDDEHRDARGEGDGPEQRVAEAAGAGRPETRTTGGSGRWWSDISASSSGPGRDCTDATRAAVAGAVVIPRHREHRRGSLLGVDPLDRREDVGLDRVVERRVAELEREVVALLDRPGPEVLEQLRGLVVVAALPGEDPVGAGDRVAVAADAEDVEAEVVGDVDGGEGRGGGLEGGLPRRCRRR